MSDRVFLTGATGFVGRHVADELQRAGYAVRALVRHADARPPGCETIVGDLRAAGDLVRGLDGCRYLVHCAALYSFAPADRKALRQVNVAGTAGLLEAARVAGVERAVVTSSSATLGPARGRRAANEGDWAHDEARSGYHRSKVEQERAAFAARLPVVVLLPTAPVGPGDGKPTPTGQMVLDFARGRLFAKPPAGGGLNLVAVEDVARAHVAALEWGRTGERYVVGGENFEFERVWELLATVTGRRVPRWHIPGKLALAMAFADELRCRLQPDAKPVVPLEGVRMSSERMYVDHAKAVRELGHRPGPVRAALERAVTWYRAHGYLN